MARYVVVEFNNNADADEFVRQMSDDNKDRRKAGLSFAWRVVGVFVKPGRTCTCSGWEKGNCGAKDWPFGIALGEKFGWWICDNCNKPRRGGHQLNNQLDMADTYEGVVYDGFEFGVTSIDVTGILNSRIGRHKKLRPRKVK